MDEQVADLCTRDRGSDVSYFLPSIPLTNEKSRSLRGFLLKYISE